MTNLPELNQLISLKGKCALITGAAVGIGKAIARRFAEAGANLELADLDSAALCKTRDELAAFNVKVHLHVADLSCTEKVDGLWATFNSTLPDILVNNAGIYPFMPFIDADEDFYRRVMDTNLHSVYQMCHNMIRLRRKTGGVIINVGSIEAVLPFKEDLAHYSISKAGVIALTRSLAKEYARHGFRVNAILPGAIITQGTKAAAKQILRLKLGLLKTGYEFSQRLPIRRFGQPDEVARIALVLASDLSTYVHGAAIPIDGGFLSA